MINKRLIRENRGFTLIEILAVIVLISLIVIIAIPSVKSISTKSKRKLFDTKVKIVEEAVNLWGENNISCFETGCDVLSDCQEIENNTKKCKTTFGLLAKNNIINYDDEVDGVSYVVNPIDSSNMNDYVIDVFLDKKNNVITSELDLDSITDSEIIDIISSNKNNNMDEDADKDGDNNTTEGSSNNTITITIDYNNGKITTITSIINGSIILDSNKAKKDGYTFERWQITSGSDSASVNGNNLTVSNSDVRVQAQYKVIGPVSFSTDSWATIAANVQANKEATASVYSVGSEKEVAIGGINYTVRIANNSNYDCSLESKTACGFVVEFVDIVEKRAMNSSDTNVGGWPATAMRAYLNGDFIAKLPSDLQNVIIDTTVVSGHGSTTRNSKRADGNWESTDRIYLLSSAEVWINGVPYYETAASTTRQLDYYSNKEVTISNYGEAKKNYNDSAYDWWLRSAESNADTDILYVYLDGSWWLDGAGFTYGVAPAFRIG